MSFCVVQRRGPGIGFKGKSLGKVRANILEWDIARSRGGVSGWDRTDPVPISK